jgi:release factor glutamine methyltransferase
MQATIKFITEELNPLYPEKEVEGFIRLIMESACDLSFTQFALKQYRVLTEEEFKKIKKIVTRLKRFEPIQYILGEAEFYGLKFNVDPSVLIPRQETEELVDWVLKSEIKSGLKVLDIGTGSGCIAISIKKERPDLDVTAVDISEKALVVARENAQLNQAGIKFYLEDILNPVLIISEKYDVIVSNPPYIRESGKVVMSLNILDYEPESALFVPDSDPLKFYTSISDFAFKNLKPEGFLFFEINETLSSETTNLLEINFCNIELRKDINGKFRMIKAQKPEKEV